MKAAASALLLLAGSIALGAENPQAIMPERHLALFEQHCFDCHDADTEKGGVNLEDLSFDLGTLPAAELWQKVLNTVNAGEMPPKKKKPIPESDKAALLKDLSRQLVTARKILSDSGGKTTVRRLNRREYANTMKALLGVEPDVANLPSDEGSGGFDTAGASLFFSSDQFEQYLTIARQALKDSLIIGPKPQSKRVRHEAETVANRSVQARANGLKKKKKNIDAYRASGKAPTEFGFIDAARVKFEEDGYNNNYPYLADYLKRKSAKTGALMNHTTSGTYTDRTILPAKAPHGKYLLRIRAGLLPGAPITRRFLELGEIRPDEQPGEMTVLTARKVTAPMRTPQIIEIPFTLGSTTRTFGLRERAHNNRFAGRSIFRSARTRNKVGPPPALWVDWVEWEGPIVDTWPPVEHQAIFFRGPKAKQDSGYARAIIERFAERAFRVRKATPKYLDRLTALYESEREAGQSFEQALIEPMAVILASPSFLYQLEPGDSTPRDLNGPELAVRLAYFLWSAPPDADLMRAARAGELSNPKQLAKQTDRMIDDPRSMAFVSGFSHQWLHMDRLDFFQFSHTKYPKFDESMRASAREEIYQTIRHLLEGNRPLGELLDADSIVINDVLADFYGIKDVAGSHFRRVELPDDSPRGGLLGTAAVMAMGSDGDRSSPVERGAWVLRTLLNDAPPPAPANVPQLSRLEGKVLTARDKLAAHTEAAQCAQCHETIDPLGFGLENFDAVGRWRTHEAVAKKRGFEKLPIDPSGSMPDGTAFADFHELRQHLAGHESDLARSFTEGLVAYGLGRPFGFTDHDLAESIMKRGEAASYSPRAFILALVNAPEFRRK